MTRSRFASLIVACLACAAAVAVDTGRCLVNAVRYGWDYVVAHAFRAPDVSTKSQPVPEAQPRVALVKARAFMANLVKRDRPTVTPYWRMCPST